MAARNGLPAQTRVSSSAVTSSLSEAAGQRGSIGIPSSVEDNSRIARAGRSPQPDIVSSAVDSELYICVNISDR